MILTSHVPTPPSAAPAPSQPQLLRAHPILHMSQTICLQAHPADYRAFAYARAVVRARRLDLSGSWLAVESLGARVCIPPPP